MRALITGVSRGGIGGAIARRLLRDTPTCGEPAKLVVTATGLKPTFQMEVDGPRAMGGDVLPLAADLGDPSAPSRLIDDAVKFCGGLDACILPARLRSC